MSAHLVTRRDATVLTANLRDAMAGLSLAWDRLAATAAQAFNGRVWVSLGYASWDAYCGAELDASTVRMPLELRVKVIGELTEAGMSTRAIAPVVGVSQKTVVKDRQVIPEVSPSSDDDEHALTQAECEALDDANLSVAELSRQAQTVEASTKRITGVDGKSYPKPAPTKPRRKPIIDAFSSAVWAMRGNSVTLRNLVADNRFKGSAEQVSFRNRGWLLELRNAIDDVLAELPDVVDGTVE